MRRRLVTAAPLVAAALWLESLLWQSRTYVPIWDGRVYAECAVRAATLPFAMGALRCAEHPTHAYIGILSLVQRLSPGSVVLMLATNVVLLAVGAVASARLLRAVFPAPELALERTLLVSALVIDPVVVASLVQVNVDFAVLVFLLCATTALVEGRRGWAVVFGVLASFSKETGALLYGGLLVAWWAAAALPRPVPRDVRNAVVGALLGFAAGMVLLPWAWWTVPAAAILAGLTARVAYERPLNRPALLAAARRLTDLAPLAVPLLGYAAYLVGRATLMPSTRVLWGTMPTHFLVRLLLFPQLSPTIRDYLALIFVLNFHWVIGAIITLDVALRGLGAVRSRPRPTVAATNTWLVRFAAILLAVETYLVTRIPTAVNARYMMPVFPLLFTVGLASALRLRVPPSMRRALLGAVVALFALSARHTIDPVSRALWGTLPMGRHGVLYVKSLIRPYGPAESMGKDETVYNLETFTALASLVQIALDRLHPVRDRVFVTGGDANWHVVGPVDARSQRRLWGRDLVEPAVYEASQLAVGSVHADSAWFIELPFVSNADALRALAPRYTIGPSDTLWLDGYAIGLRRVTARRETSADGGNGDLTARH